MENTTAFGKALRAARRAAESAAAAARAASQTAEWAAQVAKHITDKPEECYAVDVAGAAACTAAADAEAAMRAIWDAEEAIKTESPR